MNCRVSFAIPFALSLALPSLSSSLLVGSNVNALISLRYQRQWKALESATEHFTLTAVIMNSGKTSMLLTRANTNSRRDREKGRITRSNTHTFKVTTRQSSLRSKLQSAKKDESSHWVYVSSKLCFSRIAIA